MKQTITRASLTDKAYVAIRDMVLEGRIASGQRITVRPISEQLGLSPTPVNAALALLAREGVLVAKLYRGFFVPELTVGDMREIYEVRRGLDLVAVQRACDSQDHADIAAILAEYCDRQERSLQKGDINGYRMEDLAFHSSLWKLSGNERLSHIGENMLDQMRLGNAVSARQPGRGPESLEEHRRVVQAIAQGNAEGGEQAVKDHLQLTLLRFKEGLGRVA